MYGYRGPSRETEEQLRERQRRQIERELMKAEAKLSHNINKEWKDIEKYNKSNKWAVVNMEEEKPISPLTSIAVGYTDLTPKELKELHAKLLDSNNPENKTKPITIMNIRRDIKKTLELLNHDLTYYSKYMEAEEIKRTQDKIKRLELMEEIFSGETKTSKTRDFSLSVRNRNERYFTGGKTKKRRRKKRKKRKTKKKRRRKKKTRKRGGMPGRKRPSSRPARPKPPKEFFLDDEKDTRRQEARPDDTREQPPRQSEAAAALLERQREWMRMTRLREENDAAYNTLGKENGWIAEEWGFGRGPVGIQATSRACCSPCDMGWCDTIMGRCSLAQQTNIGPVKECRVCKRVDGRTWEPNTARRKLPCLKDNEARDDNGNAKLIHYTGGGKRRKKKTRKKRGRRKKRTRHR